MGYMLIGIAAGFEEAVKLFRDYPFPTRIVRSAQNEPAAIADDPADLIQDQRVLGNVLDHLRAQDTRKRLVGKRQSECGALNQRPRKLAAVPQFSDKDVERNRILGKGADDAARAAPDVQHRTLALDQAGQVPVPRPLPVALKRDGAVIGAIIIVGRHYRVPEPPQRPESP